MPSIRFEYTCTLPFKHIEVLANEDGTGVLVVDMKTQDEFDIETLSQRDRQLILSEVADWKQHYEDMRRLPEEEHPANGEFGASYVRGLNKDMGKQ